MGRNKDDFIARTGGFRIGETPEQFAARAKQIEFLESLIREGKVERDHLEIAHANCAN